MTTTRPQWQDALDSTAPEDHEGARHEGIRPMDGQVGAEVARSGATDIRRSRGGRETAFADKRWLGMEPSARKQIMVR